MGLVMGKGLIWFVIQCKSYILDAKNNVQTILMPVHNEAQSKV